MEKGVSSSAFGREGERRAAQLLEREGWTIVARNFRAGGGEIDLIASRGENLIFVEVKRWSRCGPSDLSDALGKGKARRIIETSKLFLAKYRQYKGKRIRYDVLFLPYGAEALRYEGAFDETI